MKDQRHHLTRPSLRFLGFLKTMAEEPLEVWMPLEGKEPRPPRLRHAGVQPHDLAFQSAFIETR